MYRSTNGGATVTSIGHGGAISHDLHADQHLVVAASTYSPTNRQAFVCTDGGIFRTDDVTTAGIGTGTWADLNSTYQTSQYHGAAGNNAAGLYVGGTQDNGTLSTAVSSTSASVIVDGDGGLSAIDPTDPRYVYGEYQFLNIFRYIVGGGTTNIARSGGPNQLTDADLDLVGGSAHTAAFIGPYVLDPHNANVMYAAGKSVWKTTNVKAAAPDWFSIRPPANDVALGIAVAPSNANVIWVTQADKVIAKTENATVPNPFWTIVHTAASNDVLPKRVCTSIYIDPANAGVVYLTFGGYSSDSLWRTLDGGNTCAGVYGSGLTGLPPAPARSVVRHPRNSNVLFVGTEVGLYESDDGGGTWTPLQDGPNDAPVYEVRFVYGTEQLLIATHGRGLWTANTAGVPSNAPADLVATATGTTSVSVTWKAYPGATSYQLFKSNNGGSFSPISIAGTSYSDTNVVANTTYLYKVKAVIGSTTTDFSNVDLATTVTFANDNALQSKTILTTYLQELRNATNMALGAAGLATVSWPSLTAGVTLIQASDINAVRAALVNAYYGIGLPIPSFAEAVLPSGAVKASHVQELRNLVK